MNRRTFEAYMLYAANLPSDRVQVAQYDAEIAGAYERGDSAAMSMVKAVWAVNEARGQATRRLYDAAATLCAHGTLELLWAMRQNVSVVAAVQTDTKEGRRVTLRVAGPGGGTFEILPQVAAVAVQFHLLTWYPQYLHSIAGGGAAFSVDDEHNLFVDMCTSLHRVADGADLLSGQEGGI